MFSYAMIPGPGWEYPVDVPQAGHPLHIILSPVLTPCS